MNINQLKTYIAVIETGSFTKAAKTVNLTQSAVSLQIKRLEEELGLPLLTRIAKAVKLTAAGRDLLQYAKIIIHTHDEAVLTISKRELLGHIRIGAPEDYISPFLTRILSRFAKDHSQVKVDVISNLSVNLKRAVDQADLDFALCSELSEGGTVVFREPMAWISSTKHKQHEITGQIPLAVSYEGCPYRRWATGSLEEAGREFRINYNSPTSTGIMAAVRVGFSVAVMGVTNIPEDLMIVGEEQGFPSLPIGHITLHRAPMPSSPLLLAFEQHIRDTFKEVQHELHEQLRSGARVQFA
ncbi:MAG: LysR family transcriptional regulator [Desulfobacterales bacterium]|nr:LysR family transcriptional regulator [Desulfobacterales bacterium]